MRLRESQTEDNFSAFAFIALNYGAKGTTVEEGSCSRRGCRGIPGIDYPRDSHLWTQTP